jgi:nicastrin
VYDDAANLNYNYFNTSADFDQLDDSTKQSSSPIPADSVQAKIRNIATLISLGLYDILSNETYTEQAIASSTLVDEFLYCYLVATKCRLFDSIYYFPGEFRGFDSPPQRYVSVQASVTLEATGWAHRVFGFVLSETLSDVDKENCSVLPRYFIPGSQKKGECRLTTQNLSYALSPAFEDESYNFKSNQYSTWTESTWNELSARIFLQPSTMHESFTFAIGSIVMILSFIIVYFVNSKAEILFSDTMNAEQ